MIVIFFQVQWVFYQLVIVINVLRDVNFGNQIGKMIGFFTLNNRMDAF